MKFKEILKSTIIGIIIAGLLFGCGMPSMNTSTRSDQSAEKINFTVPISKAIGVLQMYGYANGIDSADPSALTYDITKEYEDWKSKYVTNEGIKNPGSKLRVKRNEADKSDTVSEGIGYGMLLSVYFNDEKTFTGLYYYSQSHKAIKDDQNSRIMHWKVRKNDQEVSEFDEYTVDFSDYNISFKDSKDKDINFTFKSEDVIIPHGRVLKNKRNGKIIVLPLTFNNWNRISADLRTYIPKYFTELNSSTNSDASGDFYFANEYARDKGSSALDADEDMATALIMAYYRWHNKYYLDEAKIFAKDILKNCITDSDFIKAGNLWGSESCWNPSYFAPSWFRLYAQICPEDAERWNKVIENGYAHLAKVNAANGTAGFFPDWCDTSGTTAVKANGSDRHYIDDDGKNVKLQSFNYYYDGVRTPWRIAMDYSWFGSSTETKAYDLISETANTVKSIGITEIVDGYSIDGTAWKRTDRDGFNNLYDPATGLYKNGGTSHSSTFVAMNSTVSMLSNDAAFRKACFDETVKIRDSLPLTYFGDCLRLMSLLYLTGRFINLCDSTSIIVDDNKTTADKITYGPLKIDAGNVDFTLYGISGSKLNDYAHLYNSDGSKFSIIGSGEKNLNPGPGNSGEMNLGYCTVIGGVRCGTDTLTIRDSIIHGNVYARGNLANFWRDPWCKKDINGEIFFYADPDNANIRYIEGFIKAKINSDEGINAMEFSAAPADFQTGSASIPQNPANQSFKLKPGYYGQFNSNGGNTITFVKGTYCFESFSIGVNDKLIFPADDSVVIFIKSDLSMKSGAKMLNLNGGTEEGADPSKILTVVGSTNWIKLEPQTHWRGTLIVPNGNLEMNTGYNSILVNSIARKNYVTHKIISKDGEAFGAFYAKYVEAHQGSCTFLVPFNYGSIKGWTMPAPGSGGVDTPANSGDNNLSGLTISQGTLTPGFSSSTTGYSATVPNAVSSITVTAAKADTNAGVAINGTAANSQNINLNVGVNNISIVVTAQNGTQKTYTLTVTRESTGSTAPIVITTSGISVEVNGQSTYSITLSGNTKGYIQIEHVDGLSLDKVQVSTNGGTSFTTLTSSDWSKQFPVSTNSTVILVIKTISKRTLKVSFWTGG